MRVDPSFPAKAGRLAIRWRRSRRDNLYVRQFSYVLRRDDRPTNRGLAARRQGSTSPAARSARRSCANSTTASSSTTRTTSSCSVGRAPARPTSPRLSASTPSSIITGGSASSPPSSSSTPSNGKGAGKGRPDRRPPRSRRARHPRRARLPAVQHLGRRLAVPTGGKLYERTSVVITTDLSFSEWATVLGDAKMTADLIPENWTV